MGEREEAKGKCCFSDWFRAACHGLRHRALVVCRACRDVPSPDHARSQSIPWTGRGVGLSSWVRRRGVPVVGWVVGDALGFTAEGLFSSISTIIGHVVFWGSARKSRFRMEGGSGRVCDDVCIPFLPAGRPLVIALVL